MKRNQSSIELKMNSSSVHNTSNRHIIDSDSSSFVKQKRVDNLREACGLDSEELLKRHHDRRRFIVRSFLIEELKT